MRAAAVSAVLLCAAAGKPDVVAPEMVNLTGFDVVIMGEVHDNPTHHANQADWVARLQPTAVVYEMLTPLLADVAQVVGPDDDALGDVLQWEDRGWPDFAMYAPIFQAAPEAAIWGGDVEPDTLRQAVRGSAAQALGESAQLFGLDVQLPRLEQEVRESMMAASHCGALPTSALPDMVEAQRLRDAALARAVMGALITSGPPVAVITGNGHARTDWGLPTMLHLARPDIEILSVGQLESAPSQAQPFDVIILSDAPARGDPCDAFR